MSRTGYRTPLPDIMDQARGRWPGILTRLGVPAGSLLGKHGPCPVCGGKDRFRFDNKGGDGTFICNQCGAGKGIRLVMLLKGCDFKEAARLVRELVPSTPKALPGKVERTTNRAFAESIWAEGKPMTGTAGEAYLARRGIAGATSPALRFHPDCKLTDVPGHPRAPAVLARVSDPGGRLCGVTRTYLDGDDKARWPDTKGAPMAQRKFIGDFARGCAIRLADPMDGKMAVAEGFETAFAVGRIWSLPCWALLNTSLMEQWSPPQGVEAVLIGGDNDPKYGGQRAAYVLAHRLSCFKHPIQAAVRIPREPGTDWLDVLNAKEGRAHE